MRRVDPSGLPSCCRNVLHRHVYDVCSLYALWHVDWYHKSIWWKKSLNNQHICLAQYGGLAVLYWKVQFSSMSRLKKQWMVTPSMRWHSTQLGASLATTKLFPNHCIQYVWLALVPAGPMMAPESLPPHCNLAVKGCLLWRHECIRIGLNILLCIRQRRTFVTARIRQQSVCHLSFFLISFST